MNNIDFEIGDDFVSYSCTQNYITYIVKRLDEETIKAIRRYCEENNIIPNIIEEEKLELVLRLGIEELNKREIEGEDNENKNKA